MGGSFPDSNITSSTGPITWRIFPMLWFVLLCVLIRFLPVGPRRTSFQRLGAAHDLHQLLGDCRLAGAVVQKRQAVDHLGCVVGRGIHRRHPGTVLARRALKQRPENLYM